MSKQTVVLRHVVVACTSALLVYLFYLSYGAWGVQPALWPDWGQDHPFWRAWAHAAFVLLFLTLVLSPAATLWKPVKRMLPWRRELGIWFAVLSFGHAYAIWDRWARWDVATLFGFQYVEELNSYVLARPEVGIMNMMGMILLPMIVLLAVTSTDRAVGLLGSTSWKWLHRTLVPVIFYVALLRGVLYFFYFFQTTPPDWRVYPSIWFLYVFLGMGVAAVTLQGAAFAKTVLQRQRRLEQRLRPLTVVAVGGVVMLFVLPLVLLLGTVAYFDSRSLDENPALAAQGQAPPEPGPDVSEEYAQSFEMTIRADGQENRLWLRDLDEAPYFRVTTEIDGTAITHQVYRFDERALFVAEPDDDGAWTWTRAQDLAPEEIQFVRTVVEPAAWAARYGVGEHRIQLPEGDLDITIHSVDESVPDEIFDIVDAELSPQGRPE